MFGSIVNVIGSATAWSTTWILYIRIHIYIYIYYYIMCPKSGRSYPENQSKVGCSFFGTILSIENPEHI